MGVGDDEGDAGETSGDQTSQERRPAGPVLGAEDVDTEDLPVAVGVHAGGDDSRHQTTRPPSRTLWNRASSQR